MRRDSSSKVLIIDADNRLGGRVHTVSNNYGDLIEFGPMRILDTHTHTLDLCKQYDIPLVIFNDNFNHSPIYFTSTQYDCTKSLDKSISMHEFMYRHFCEFYDFPFFDYEFVPLVNNLIIRDLFKYGLTILTCSFEKFVTLFFSKVQQDILWTLFPYDHLNKCPVSLSECLETFLHPQSFKSYRPLHGFSSIISSLSAAFHHSGGLSLLKTKVKTIQIIDDLYSVCTQPKNSYTSSQIFFAIPPSCVLLISGISSLLPDDIIKYLKSIGHYSSQKSFYTFTQQSEISLLQNYDGFFRTSYPNRIGHWNPCVSSLKHKTLLASYNSFSSSDINYLPFLNSVLPFDLSTPSAVISFDWKNSISGLSAHFWIPGSFDYSESNRLNSFSDSLFFVGEAYCQHHGWIESALLSTKQIF